MLPREFMPYVLVAMGGALGAVARFVVATLVNDASGGARFPYGTFTVNVVGSFLLGILGTVLAERIGQGEHALNYALAVGFLGSFTTFSTFAFEKNRLLENSEYLVLTLYLTLTVGVGLIMVRLGVLVARHFFGTPA